MKKYFYIIQRSGQISEIEFSQERYNSTLLEWKNGGLIIFNNLGLGINSVDISNILNDEQYENYVETTQPKQFVKNGAWYDLKDRNKVVRYEKWRELELEEKRKVMLADPYSQKPTQEMINSWLKKYTPKIVKQKRDLVNKMKIT